MKRNKFIFAFAASLAMLSFSSCSDDINYEVADGEGKILINPLLNYDLRDEARSLLTGDELREQAIVWISNSNGVVRKFQGFDNIPAGGIALKADSYVAEVWSGDSVPASFEHRYFKGRELFTVGSGTTTQVDIECSIANVVAQVVFDPSVDEVLSNYSLTAGISVGSLEYVGHTDENREGYFMMNSKDKDLQLKLQGTLADGSSYTKESVIADAKPGTRYTITVKHNGPTIEEYGGGIISIQVDETETTVDDPTEIFAAPTFAGTNFDLSRPVTGSVGTFDEKKVWVTSTNGFKSLTIACNGIGAILGISGDDFDIFKMSQAVADQVAAHGISFQHFTHAEENSAFEEVKINFSREFLNEFPNGDYNIVISATDNSGKSNSATINLMVSDAKVATLPIEENSLEVYTDRLTLHGTVLKDGQTGFVFNFREKGQQQYRVIPATVISRSEAREGDELIAEVDGLSPATTYEFQSACDGFTPSDWQSVTTDVAAQLPNAGMEQWCTGSNGAYLAAASEGALFWDSGNHGSITMKKNVTTQSEEVKHSGKYSAKLSSQFVGIGMIGKFAAGNLFIGKYLATEGTDGILGWGRPFTARPKALKVYVQYNPAAITDSSVSEAPKGSMDTGIIYMALLDGSTMNAGGNNGDWPVVIKTKSKQLFDKDGDNVVAYGEHIFTEATNGMIEVTIPLDYKRTDIRPSNIMITCSASRYGDYFTGGPSVMYLDDFELIY